MDILAKIGEHLKKGAAYAGGAVRKGIGRLAPALKAGAKKAGAVLGIGPEGTDARNEGDSLGRAAAMEALRSRRRRRGSEKKAKRIMLIAAAAGAVLLAVLLIAGRVRRSRAGGIASEEGVGGKAGEVAEEVGEGPGGTKEPPIIRATDLADGETVTFTAVGDNLIHGSIFRQADDRKEDGYDFDFCYERIAPYFRAHDINWINIETIINNAIPPSNFPRFSTPGDDGHALYDANFRVFSLASNHTYDYGDDGVYETLRFWKNEMPDDICTTGIWTDDEDIPVYTYNGHRIAFLTYTLYNNQNASGNCGYVITIYEQQRIREQIALAKERADAVIVSCHWGDENHHAINDEQRNLAKSIAEWGADLIIGTHPHVVQDYTFFDTDDARRVFCIYSIGNFISGQKGMDQLVGLILQCDLVFIEDGEGEERVEVRDPKLIPTITHYGRGFTDLQVMLLSDYTREMAAKHGVLEYDSDFSYDAVFDMLPRYVIGDCLEMPERK